MFKYKIILRDFSYRKIGGGKYKNILSEYLLYFLIILVAYSLPQRLAGIFLISIFFYGIFIQKNIVRWIFLFLLISNSPGYLFSFADVNYNLMELGIQLTEERGLSFQEIFMLFMFIYAILSINKFQSVFKRIYIFLVIYIFIVFIFTSFELSGFKILRTIRGLIPHLAYFFIPIVFRSKKEYIELLLLLIPFPIFVIFVQFFELAIHQTIIEFLGSSLDWGPGVSNPERLARQNYSQVILLFCLFSSFYLLSSYDKFKMIYSKNFLLSIIGVINLSIFFSATRGYFIASIIGTFLYASSLFSLRKVFKLTIYILIIAGFIYTIPFGQKQLIGSYERISTVKTIFSEKDLTAGSTTGRVDYAIELLEKVKEKPLMGFGFSQTFWDYANVHTGIGTNALNGGILGLIIICYFWLIFFRKTIIRNYRTSVSYKRQLVFSAICLLTFIIVHLTSNYIFSFIHLTQADGRIIVIALLYSFVSQIIIEDRTIKSIIKDS